MPKVLSQAVQRYWREYILKQTNAAYASLRTNPEAWQEEQEEHQVWEATLADGLEE